MENLNQLMASLEQDQKDTLLYGYLTQELAKKANEINKNYKDDTKRSFALSNIMADFRNRLLKKITGLEMANQIEDTVSV